MGRVRFTMATGGIMLGLLALPSGASAATQCNPDMVSASRFCVDATQTVTPTLGTGFVATKPFGLNLSFANSSPGVATGGDGTNESRWLQSLKLEELGTTGPPTVTSSADLPNTLLIAGGGTCTAPSYADCSAGHGTVRGVIHAPGGLGDGATTGAFGISKVVNINPPAAGNAVDWRVTIDACVNISGCQSVPEQQVEIQIPEPAGNDAVEPTIMLPMREAGVDVGSGATADVTLESGSLHFDGVSNFNENGEEVDGGPIFRLPAGCDGELSGQATFTSADARQVVFTSEPVPIVGCTVTAVKPRVRHHKVKVKGSVKPEDVAEPPVGDDGEMDVTLCKQTRHGLRGCMHASPVLTDGRFKSTFAQPRARKCNVSASFLGGQSHANSSAEKTFKC